MDTDTSSNFCPFSEEDKKTRANRVSFLLGEKFELGGNWEMSFMFFLVIGCLSEMILNVFL